MPTETEHVLAELRSMRTAHTEVLSKVSELCGGVKELVVELRHTQKDYDSLSRRIDIAESDVIVLRLEGAGNAPFMDIAKTMLRNQWATMATAALAVGGTQIPFAKMFGG